MTLALDLETYSSVDLRKASVYKYAEAPDFDILLMGYAVDDEPVTVLDLAGGDQIPDEIVAMLKDPDVIKTAFNASFERQCLSAYLGAPLAPEGWHCSMVHAATLGLPRSLADVGRVLGLPEDRQKMKEGKALIQYFCKPCKPTKANGGRTRNRPADAPEQWKTFVEYNRRDVEVERDIRRKLDKYPLPQVEWDAYQMDQRINDRGVLVDTRMAKAAIQMARENTDELTDEAKAITGLENVNSVRQLKDWLDLEGSLDKKAVKALLEDGNLDADRTRLLAIRQELGKSSVSKYEAMLRGACRDGRVRGLFAFYGAATGRWAGRQVQVQNLPQNHIEDLDTARQIVLEGDRKALQALFGPVPQTLSELIRTAFIAKPGHTFCVADFSAIEARVIAWLGDERWRQDVFANNGDIYCASASQMFHVPVEKHGVNGHLRQKGKIAELALGYGGAVGALTAMGALEMGLSEDELPDIVKAWRAASPHIVDLWWKVDAAAKDTIAGRDPNWRYDLPHGLSMRYANGLLHVRLPSGRCLRYCRPAVNAEGQIVYQTTNLGHWTQVETYGPKLIENIVQATARDCLRDAMMAVEKRFPGIVMHVHDEMIVEVEREHADECLAHMLDVMSRPIEWAPGLKLKGDGYRTDYYKKD